MRTIPKSEIFQDYGLTPLGPQPDDLELTLLYDRVRGLSLSSQEFEEIGEKVKINGKNVSQKSLKLQYEYINEVCQEKRLEYKEYQLELLELKKNSNNLVGFLQEKDAILPSSEHITSVALLSDKSEVKKDISLHIQKNGITLKDTICFIYQLISSKILGNFRNKL